MQKDGFEQNVSINDPGEIGRADHSRLDGIVIGISNVFAWIFPVLMIAIVAQIFLRGAGMNQAWLDDLQWWLYGVSMMAGLAYAVITHSHVRVDIFYQSFSEAKQARIETVALGWMLLPFCLMMTDILIHYALSSIDAREGSDSPNGLHGLYYLKSALPVLFVVCGLAAWASYRRHLIKFTSGTAFHMLVFAFPAAVFLLWRMLHYMVFWWVRMTNVDLHPRQVSKEPIFEILFNISFASVIVLLIVLYFLSRLPASEDAE